MSEYLFALNKELVFGDTSEAVKCKEMQHLQKMLTDHGSSELWYFFCEGPCCTCFDLHPPRSFIFPLSLAFGLDSLLNNKFIIFLSTNSNKVIFRKYLGNLIIT